MKRSMGFFCGLWILFGLSTAGANRTPAQQGSSQPFNLCEMHRPTSSTVPRCPSSPMLDESYPVMALAVSDVAGEYRFLISYIEKILSLPVRIKPTIYAFVAPENYTELLKHIDRLPSQEQRRLWTRSVIPVTINNWNWQQDYFEVFFNRTNGMPVARPLSRYRPPEGSDSPNPYFAGFPVNVNVNCPIEAGPPLNTGRREKGGHYGGNIEAIKNFCVLGDATLTESEWRDYARQICNDPNKVIKAKTWFMLVGHTDEIMKTLPVKRSVNSCGYAVGLASTEKALKLMRENPNDQAFALDPSLPLVKRALMMASSSYSPYCVAHKALKAGQSKRLQEELEKKEDFSAFAFAQEVMKKNRQPAQNRETKFTIEEIRDVMNSLRSVVENRERSLLRIGGEDFETILGFYNFLKGRTEAQLLATNWNDFSYNNEMRAWASLMFYVDCTDMTNKDVLDVLAANPNFMKIQTDVQIEMNKTKQLITEKFHQYDRQCRPTFVEFPYLFNNENRTQMMARASMVSTFPNATNSEIIDDHILVPDPSNRAFKADIEMTLTNLGYKVDFIDTNYQHALFGNLHCSSHAFRYCRP